MKKLKTLSLAALLTTGLVSVTFAAQSIPGRIDGDLSFFDKVKISSGVTFPEDLTGNTGESSVKFDGEGSLTIGSRSGDGFPRLVVYGGTTVKVSQNFENREKKWWNGELKSPVRVLSVPDDLLKFDDPDKHDSEKKKIRIINSFGFGSDTDTLSFSPAGYVVLPVEVPDGTKVFYAFHSLKPGEEAGAYGNSTIQVKESNFCLAKDRLCVIEVSQMNQVLLIQETYNRCPVKNIKNGKVGSVPFCQITCDDGYELDEMAESCVSKNGETEANHSSAGKDVNTEEDNKPMEQKTTKKDDLRFLGSKLSLIDTTGLEGKELRNALRRNAEISRRLRLNEKVAEKDDSKGLAKMINNIKWEMWSWTGGDKTKVAKNNEVVNDNVNAEAVDTENGGTETHSAAPLLPSTGSSSIFVIISILGIGLMLLAFKRQ